jgi:hypothetical protein
MRAGAHDLSAVLEDADGDAAVALMLAGALVGRPPSADQVARFIASMSHLAALPILVGCAAGDRVGMLVDMAASGRLSHERTSLALFLAVELLGDAPPPPGLLTQLRLHAREPLSSEAGVTLGIAASGVSDPGVRAVAAEWIELASVSGGERLQTEMRRLLAGPLTAVLPEREPPRVVSGYTVRRAVVKIGRNEPCPCGSGKKYKRCCAEKDETRTSDPSPVAGVTMAEYRASAHRYMDAFEFEQLRPAEMAACDLAQLPALHLVVALRKLARYRAWTDAERVMEELGRRGDLRHGTPDDHRLDLIHNAVSARAHEVAARQVAKLADPSLLGAEEKVALELLRPTERTLESVEAVVAAALRDPGDPGTVEISYRLLENYPALGIVFTRGVLDPNRPLDSEMLLREVEAARDRLQLPPGDPAWEIYEQLLDHDVEDRLAHASVQADRELVDEAWRLRVDLKEATARVEELETRLRVREEDLRTATIAAPVEVPGHPPSATDRAEEERKRLRAHIAELKQLVADGNAERRRLRNELATSARQLQAVAERPSPVPSEAELDDEETLPAEPPPRLQLLMPTFSAAAVEALRSTPLRVAQDALARVAKLAGGDEAAWRSVKRLRSASDVYSERVGIHHRLLFRLDPRSARLEVTAFILRRDLEVTLRRGVR